MARKKHKESEEEFIKHNHLEQYYGTAKENIPELWNILEGISERYVEYSKNCKGAIQRLSDDILDDGHSDIFGYVHSVRYRVKDITSLKVKIVKKIYALPQTPADSQEIEKYRLIGEDNFDKILTDLIGYRIIIRYREQWAKIHEWIKKIYYQGTNMFVNDYIKDYQASGQKIHIAEQPKVYYRDLADKTLYEQYGGDFYKYIQSHEGYNSVHYILNVDGKYVELQVRTIFDEAWSECTHDLVYKKRHTKEKLELDYLSKCLATQTIAAESIVNLMYRKTHPRESILLGKTSSIAKLTSIDKKTGKVTSKSDDKNEMNKTLNNIKKRMDANESQIDSFDGNIKNIF